jgi:cytochrome c
MTPALPSDRAAKSLRRSLILWLALGAAGCGGAAGATEAEMANGRNQAGTGALLYERTCQACHGVNGEGTKEGPAILGKKRLSKKFSNAQQLFDYVAEKMPKDNPGSLDIGQYWNVVTFIVATTRKTIPDDRLSESNAPDVKLKD